ncbi:MAG: hypothetical protein WD669_10340 [Pirellulales bacterium]
MSKNLVISFLLLVVLPLEKSYGVIFTDNFNTNWTGYASGIVSPTGIWSGVYNGDDGGTNTTANTPNANQLTMGLVGVGWENNRDTGPFLYKEVNAAEFVSATVKITSQTQGNWSLAGVLVRQANPIDSLANQENWFAAWSFRSSPTARTFQSNRVLNGVESDMTSTGLGNENLLTYVRIERVEGSPGRFATFRSVDGVTWTAGPGNTDVTHTTNANLASGILQVGIAAGGQPSDNNPNMPAGANVQFDLINIETNPVPVCTQCTWNINGSGNWNTSGNWSPTTPTAPNANTASAIFGSAFNGVQATVFTDINVSVKELRFNNAASKYVLAGPGKITLDADSGDALINVTAGSHEIQTHLALADNVTANASNGTTLNINSIVELNGHGITFEGTGTIQLNNGSVGGAGSGSGAIVNGANLEGLSSLEGDLTQTGDGSLGVSVGSTAISVTGAALLDGVLDVSLADGFAPVVGQSYTVLTADSVTDAGLSLGGDAGALFRLAVDGDSVSLTTVPEPSAVVLLLLGICGFYPRGGIRRFFQGFRR